MTRKQFTSITHGQTTVRSIPSPQYIAVLRLNRILEAYAPVTSEEPPNEAVKCERGFRS